MEMKQLEYFQAIVEQGTISGAARLLHMTQPPLSYQMKMLEEELGVQLFYRGLKRITLTEAGQVLYERAASLLTMTDITKREVIKAGQATTIHLGMTPSTVNMMTEKLAGFSEKHPQIRFDIHEGSTFILKGQLENGLVDITTLRTPISLTGCHARGLLREPLCVMATKAHMEADVTGVTLEKLSGEKLILSHRYREYLLQAFEKAGLSCDIYYECEDARTAMTLAGYGVGVAILPVSMSGMTAQLRAYDILDAELTTEILLAWREENLSSETRNFLEYLLQTEEKMHRDT